jgi:hypothetical protein
VPDAGLTGERATAERGRARIERAHNLIQVGRDLVEGIGEERVNLRLGLLQQRLEAVGTGGIEEALEDLLDQAAGWAAAPCSRRPR